MIELENTTLAHGWGMQKKEKAPSMYITAGCKYKKGLQTIADTRTHQNRCVLAFYEEEFIEILDKLHNVFNNNKIQEKTTVINKTRTYYTITILNTTKR